MATAHAGRRRFIRVWDLPLRLFHWILVLTIAFAFISAEDGPLAQWHAAAGWLAAILIAFRIVWGFVGGEHARFRDFVHPARIGSHVKALISGRSEAAVGHNALGAVAIMAMLALVAAVVWTGATMQGEVGEELHEAIGNVLLALIAVHVLAVLVMSLWMRENLVAAMITGRKPAERHPGGADARPPRLAAYVVAAAVVAIAVYAIQNYDPSAFAPRDLGAEAPRTDQRQAGGDDDGHDQDDVSD